MSLDTEETPVIGLSNEYLIREFGMLILTTLQFMSLGVPKCESAACNLESDTAIC